MVLQQASLDPHKDNNNAFLQKVPPISLAIWHSLALITNHVDWNPSLFGQSVKHPFFIWPFKNMVVNTPQFVLMVG